jgi:hypothetical protein
LDLTGQKGDKGKTNFFGTIISHVVVCGT